MHTPFNAHSVPTRTEPTRLGSSRPDAARRVARNAPTRRLQRCALALLCAAMCCGATQAAPANGPLPQPAPLDAAPSGSAQAGSSGGSAAVRRAAIGGVLVLGLWQAWRLHRGAPDAAAQVPAASAPVGPPTVSPTMPPVAVLATPPAGPALALFDPDRPIPMDGVNTVGELDGLTPRILLDTLRELRGNKQFDCEHGRTSQAFLCAKIALIKAALRGHGVTWYGDESDDGCHCR